MESELSTATNVPVKLGDRSYEIVIAPGALDEVASTIAATVSTSHLLVVSDSNVAPLYLDRITDQLSGSFDRVDSMAKKGDAANTVRHGF